MDNEEIILGSGRLYYQEFNGTIQEDEVIETEKNELGCISGGASLEYKPSFYEAKDDLGRISKEIITDEEATLKSGVLTFNANKLAVLVNTGKVTETETKRTIKIGGVKNYNRKNYLLRFVHELNANQKIRVTVVGNNQAGFTLSFQKDKETVVDAEFKCKPMDKEGTLIQYDEDLPAAG